MKVCTLYCVLLAAALLTLPATAAEAAPTASHLKIGASGQVYIWQAASC